MIQNINSFVFLTFYLIPPGFRFRVRRLVQDQTYTSVDTEFTVPLGTELKYTSSCRYDSQSTQISSKADYQTSLLKESSFDSDIGFSGQGFFPFGFAVKVESNVAWGKSERYEQFVQGSSSSDQITFEARAICSEFEISFNPYAEHYLDPNFVKAFKDLPSI